MAELRKDPVVGRWVIISTERNKRPSDFPTVADDKTPGPCVFCAGQEAATPPEVLALRVANAAPHAPGWDVRVIPNQYPALRSEGELDREGVWMCDKMNGFGTHEVIVETPDHERDMADLAAEHIALVLRAYRERILTLQADTRVKHVMIFKNQGVALPRTFATHRHARYAQAGEGGTGRGEGVFRLQTTLHFLRLHPAGNESIHGTADP